MNEATRAPLVDAPAARPSDVSVNLGRRGPPGRNQSRVQGSTGDEDLVAPVEERADGGCLHGFGEQKPLSGLAALGPEALQLAGVLDTLGERLKTEGATELNQGADHGD